MIGGGRRLSKIDPRKPVFQRVTSRGKVMFPHSFKIFFFKLPGTKVLSKVGFKQF